MSLFSQDNLVCVKNRDKGSYNFWVHQPLISKLDTQPIPVILFLHGKSLSGSNLELVKRYGVLKEVIKRRQLPAYVVAPQCPKGQMWNPSKINKVVDYVFQNFNADTNRLYVVGMSMGGYGVLHFAGEFPARVAAAVALCGGGNLKDACKLATIPLWIMHGTADRAVSFQESERIVSEIKKCNHGVNLKFDILKGVGHGEPSRLFSMDELYNWLFIHSKDTVPPPQKDTILVDHKKFSHTFAKKKKVKKINSKSVKKYSNSHKK